MQAMPLQTSGSRGLIGMSSCLRSHRCLFSAVDLIEKKESPLLACDASYCMSTEEHTKHRSLSRCTKVNGLSALAIMPSCRLCTWSTPFWHSWQAKVSCQDYPSC